MKKLFTSESVTEGHPDKLCDLISDSILDAYLEKDKKARVAVETMAGKGKIFITGEITSSAVVDMVHIVRETIKKIGYFGAEYDLDAQKCEIIINVSEQSPDIALGTNDLVGGAGDQGMMFGYATNETPELMPLPIMLAHHLAEKLTYVRRHHLIEDIGPDGKVQVTVEYDNNTPLRVDTILISIEHRPNKDLVLLKEELIKKVINKVVDKKYLVDTKILVNPTGSFTIGGPLGDSGLTGRKIIVDTYGGMARHGGGAFSGKDPSKVDRTGAYMARFLAKNIVANHYADRCEIEISYAIGLKQPVSLFIDCFGTNKISEDELLNIINKKFDLSPQGIINYLGLREPIYTKTTNYGHFGKKDLPWEKIIIF